jgi:hypothetical protein
VQYTLLEMVQRILAAMDSDEVNSITDTAEAEQVALLIEGVYYDLLAEHGLPETGTLFQLNESSSSTPTLMTLPSEILNLSWVKYNTIDTDTETLPNYTLVDFMCLYDFLEFTNNYRTLDDVDSFTHNITNGDNTDTITFFHRTDKHPTYYTSFNDGTLIFDSLLIEEDPDNLLKAKTQCWGTIAPTFVQDDNYTPTLDNAQFALLMNEAKARAFVELKQATNLNAEQHARRLRIRMRNTKQKTPNDYRPFHGLPNYGRK